MDWVAPDEAVLQPLAGPVGCFVNTMDPVEVPAADIVAFEEQEMAVRSSDPTVTACHAVAPPVGLVE